MTTNITLTTIQEKSPVEIISKEAIESAVKRMRVIVPQVEKIENLTQIAQESILYRTVPGRDVYYWEDWQGNLQRTPDYKYLKNFATFKEQQLSGNDNAALEDTYRSLTADEKEQHGIPSQCIAAVCTITTSRERKAFGSEVKQWVDMGFTPQEAVALAKQTYGDLGSSAVGVVDPTELDKKGKPIPPPTGWSYLQLAEKLAFKNAVNRKYGIPTADEMQALAFRMARRAMPEHWKDIDPTLPREAQARLADYEAITEQVLSEAEQMTDDERRANLAKNVVIMRGDPENGIGEDEPAIDYNEQDRQDFAAEVIKICAWYRNPMHVFSTLKALDLEWDIDNAEMLAAELAKYATAQADAEAEKG